MDSDKIVEAEIGYVHEVSLVEHVVEKDDDQGYIEKMESMIQKASRNPSQTSVCLKTTEKISQQSEEAREQKQTLAETSFVESVDR
ncbi:hypothetical protein YC2023_098431 [Brassica napus]